METTALVAPVTALEFLKDAFLLTGEGPVLAVYSLQPRPNACASLSVLQHYRIHGIRPRSLEADPAERYSTELRSPQEINFYDVLVFGGKAVRLIRFHVDPKDEEHLLLEIVGPLMELQDWALDVRWLVGGNHSLICVAVAHNSALLMDVNTGNALFQQSCVEGCLLYSALLLVHESWTDTVLVGGTVFNQLVLWKPGGGNKSGEFEHKAPVERRLLGHSGVIFSISYLQEKGWLASASDDRSVRVWGVGNLGGTGGNCGDLNPTCFMVLYGHQARVFSVCLSQGEAFSAGEDGACLVWDLVGSGKVINTLKGHRAGGVRALAVSEGTGNEERWVATGGADGGVRLWRVEGNEVSKDRVEEAVAEKTNDLKFPGLGLPKVVRIAGEENTSWSQTKFVVCTDQGRVYQYSDGHWLLVWQGTPEFQSYCVMETKAVSVKESTTKIDLCAVGNLSGSIQVFPMSHPQCGILLTCGSGKIHSLIWKEAKESTYLLASGPEGLVHRWSIEVNQKKNCSMAISASPLPPFLLPPSARRWLTSAVPLCSTSHGLIWVCGDRRGSLLLFQEDGKLNLKNLDDKEIHICSLSGRKQTDEKDHGEENGTEKIMARERKEVGELMLHPLCCLFGLHGKQGVTSVSEYQGLLYSTGRDGCVRVVKVCPTPQDKNQETMTEKSLMNTKGLQLEVLRVQRACKGMEWLESVLILEPKIPVVAEEELRKDSDNQKKENEEREIRFVIVGFQAVNFVVWDPVRQERLLAVHCGGGHRSWSLCPASKGFWPGYGALVFIKQGAVLTSYPPGETLSCAGKSGRSGGWSLREGIHGRGIGCVCRLGRIRGIDIQTPSTGNVFESEGRNGLKEAEKHMEREDGYWEIVVTGGEDTSITVLAVQPASGSIKVLSVITDHISSIRTMTTVPCRERGGENHALSALLFSAGGRAQMQCYRLMISWDRHRQIPSCQVIQVAGHRLDEHWERRRNRHKTLKMDPETRYMSVMVVDENIHCVTLALAGSDGALRLFSVSEVKRQIDLLWETFYHQRCVLSLDVCTLEDEKGNRYKLLFSAATDGKIAVWDLTEAFSSSADTWSKAPTPPIPCLVIPAHQSGVNSLAVWVQKLGQQENGCLVTVASGGDDGQLTVSTIRVQYPEHGNNGGSRGFSETSDSHFPLQRQLLPQNCLCLHLQAQSHIPLAHAAPLTALKALRPGLIVSTSSDQRVCLWEVSSTGISHDRVLCSHIADAAGLAVWEQQMMVEKEEDSKRKTRLESDEDITGDWKESVTGFKMKCSTANSETVGISKKNKEANDEVESRQPVGVLSGTVDLICMTSVEKDDVTAGEHNNQTETDSMTKTESGLVSASHSLNSKYNRKKMGWVLVCGQGLQLLQLKNTETALEMLNISKTLKH